jgi:predicted transport protein
LLTNQYRGKESLFPLYEALLERLLSLGNDVVVAPKKGSVSFIRKRQFAFIVPASKARIDLGLKFK